MIKTFIIRDLSKEIGTIESDYLTALINIYDIKNESIHLAFKKVVHKGYTLLAVDSQLNKYDTLATIYKLIYKKLRSNTSKVKANIERFFDENKTLLQVDLFKNKYINYEHYKEQDKNVDYWKEQVKLLKRNLEDTEKRLSKKIAEREQAILELLNQLRDLKQYVDPDYLKYMELKKKFEQKR